jgi:3-deoxy-7-phosphoheptulonate synthase
MVESNLVGGRQDLIAGQPLAYGQSITDGCIDWETSLGVLERLAQAVRKRREVATQSAQALIGSPA